MSFTAPFVGRRRLGALRDPLPPAQRGGRLYRAARAALLPSSGGISSAASLPILDQLTLGSCVGQATAEAIFLRDRIQRAPVAELGSRLWNYRAGRAVDGTVDQDAGTSFRSVFTGLEKIGFPPESAFPYSDQKTGNPDNGSPTDPYRREPSADVVRLAYDQRAVDGVVQWMSVDDLDGDLGDNVVHAIGVDDYPVCIAVDVDAAFEAGAFDPNVPLKPPMKRAGGHAMVIESFETVPVNGEVCRRFKVRNSWSADFGVAGYVWFTEEYVRTGDLFLVERVPMQETP